MRPWYYDEYHERQGRRPRSQFWARRPATKAIIIACAACFLIDPDGRGALSSFALVPSLAIGKLHVWQFVTYIFMHGGLGHIFWNMLFLWWFGGDIEEFYGRNRYLALFLGAGIAGGILQAGAAYMSGSELALRIPVLGASGGLMGVLVVAAIVMPDRLLLIYFIFPMRLRTLVIIYVALDMMRTIGGGGAIAVFAHLGGAGFGYLYHRFQWGGLPDRGGVKRFADKLSRMVDPPVSDFEVDEILAKAHREGMGSLSRHERDVLMRASKQYSKRKR